MQQIRFEREGMNNYMVISCTEQLDRTSYGEIVLENVQIPGFMNYEIREIDGKQSLYYKLQYRTSLKHVSGNLHITMELMKVMIDSIVRVIQQTEEYLLDLHAILWRDEAVFIDACSGELLFAYCPHMCEESNCLQNFLVEMFQYVEKNNRQAYLYLMEFYNLITNPECTLEQMEKYRIQNEKKIAYDWGNDNEQVLDADKEEEIIREDNEGRVRKKQIEKAAVVTAIISVVNVIVALLLLLDIWTYQYIWVLILTLFLLFITVLTYHSGNQDEDPDIIMEEYLREYKNGHSEVIHPKDVEADEVENTQTTLLCTEATIVIEEGSKELFLKSVNPKENKDIIISKNNIVLGSLERSCDFIIKQKGISRMHAKIIKKEDGIFIMDLNATNGTYLNEEQLDGGKEYQLEEGDVISLAKVVTFVVAERESIY